MASAVLSDVVTDFTRHPYTMVDMHHSHQDAGNANNSAQHQSQPFHSQHTDAPPSSFSASSSATTTAQPVTASSAAQQPTSSSSNSSNSRPIDIPQAARRQQAFEVDPSDPFSQQRRPPRHEPNTDPNYNRLHGQSVWGQGDGPWPAQGATPAGVTAVRQGNTQPAMRAGQSSAAAVPPSAPPSAQHSAHASQSSNPPVSPPSPQLLPTIRSSLSMSGNSSPTRIKVRDLNHIQSFASEEVLSRRNSTTRLRGGTGRADEGGGGGGGGSNSAGGLAQKYDIASMPVQDIIEMVAGLLTKITSTNDRAHERDIKSHIPNLQNAAAAAAAGVNEPNPPAGSQHGASAGHGQNGQVDIRGMHRQTQSVLSFHGKNVPSISILMYLSRIHKYCPTTYEVFLSLLVYFDRMTENINKGVVHSFRNLDPMEPEDGLVGSPPPSRHANTPQETLPRGEEEGAGKVGVDVKPPIMHPFVVDSFNIHRLIMAGVTCASKFFSDVFYTNSRYAKVGGLPLHELNHLELQFLLLNDFKLFIPIDELEHYGSLLVQFYAEEIMAQQLRERQEREDRERRDREEGQADNNGSGDDTADEGVHMQS